MRSLILDAHAHPNLDAHAQQCFEFVEALSGTLYRACYDMNALHVVFVFTLLAFAANSCAYKISQYNRFPSMPLCFLSRPVLTFYPILGQQIYFFNLQTYSFVLTESLMVSLQAKSLNVA